VEGTESSARPPTHLKIVGIAGILWNAFGCVDYVMTQLRSDFWLSSFTPEQRAYFESFPAWLHGAWALGVWGALLGSILLLMRSRHAVTAFAVSLFGLAVSQAYQFTADRPGGLDGPAMIAIQLVIWAGALFFLVYAARMRSRGVLR
jgi:hypothetical protein